MPFSKKQKKKKQINMTRNDLRCAPNLFKVKSQTKRFSGSEKAGELDTKTFRNESITEIILHDDISNPKKTTIFAKKLGRFEGVSDCFRR